MELFVQIFDDIQFPIFWKFTKGLSGNYLAWKSSTLSPPLLIEPALWFWLYQGYFLETFLEDWRRLVIFNWDYLGNYPCQIIVVCTVPPKTQNLEKSKIQFNSVVLWDWVSRPEKEKKSGLSRARRLANRLSISAQVTRIIVYCVI